MSAGSEKSVNDGLVTTPIAIVGLASIFPGAKTLPEYWENILKKIDCISDVPASRWSVDDYYDPNPAVPDKSYCKRGGFIPDIDFDPLEFGLPPNILEVTDVSQLLGLVVARDALEDAGYGEGSSISREKTGVILGVVGMSSKLFQPLMSRLQYPVWEKTLRSAGVSAEDTQTIIEKIKKAYVGWEENSFPGAIGNVVAGRIANRFDLGGTNCVVDAACGSSLAAVRLAVGELITGRADMMITGGVDTDNSIVTYLCFSKTPAFSKSDRLRPFDAASDGMMVGEGIGMLVLKRLADAERDGDRIYAVIKGAGSSSDGRFKSIYAPRAEGQARALRRAYAEAGFAPTTVGLIEAHGTGTNAGDPEEVRSLREVLNESALLTGENNSRKHVALGSVKSQIGHTKAAAGAAGMVKVALALHHKVLPATINVTKPSPKLELDNSPVYLNTETRPWIRPADGTPRRAGVSSFGFGGTNFHIVIEEYKPEHSGAYRLNPGARQVLLSAPDAAGLKAACQDWLAKLQGEDGSTQFLNLADLSRTLQVPANHARIGFVADTPAEAVQLMQQCISGLAEKADAENWENPKGIYYRRSGLDPQGKVVALFPGQGSQYVDMGRDAALNFPQVREVFHEMDRLFVEDGLEPLSSAIYPVPAFEQADKDKQAETLQRTNHAQPAIGAFSIGLLRILQQAGFQADFTAGHSFGELPALCAAGVLSEADCFGLAKARGKFMAPPDDPNFDAGTMLAVKGDVEKVRAAIKAFPEVTLANWNSNNQVVLAGSKPAIAQVKDALAQQGFSVVPLQVAAAFHTPLVGHAQKPFASVLKETKFNAPALKVFSNTTGQAHASDPKAIREVLSGHILNPVLWKDEIEQIYAAGGRIFVEIGPKNVLTNLVDNILADKPHVSVALNASPKKDSDRQLREAVIALRVAGLPLVNFDPYAAPRKPAAAKKKSPMRIVINGGSYVTEKTRAAFTNALNDGFKIKGNGNSAYANSVSVNPAPESRIPENASSIPSSPKLLSLDITSSPLPSLPMDPSPFLNQFQTHQSESLHLHEQYLRTEEEYARAFARMTQLQTELVAKAAAGQLGSVLPLFESLERSMSKFHEHQSETLRVHERYLSTQESFDQSLMDMVQGTGSGIRTFTNSGTVAPEKPVEMRGNGFHAPAPAPVKPAAPASVPEPRPAAVAAHIPAPAPVAPPPAPAPAPVPESRIPDQRITSLNPSTIMQSLLSVVSEKTGYPVETLEPDMDMESDLGIDSIKRVEILGAVQAQHPELPKPDAATLAELRTLKQVGEYLAGGQSGSGNSVSVNPEPTLAPVSESRIPDQRITSLNPSTIMQSLLSVVSEKTGYPVETLEPDMDMESDLGIDSIKRVEILGAVQAQHPELPKPDAATLAELRTLKQVGEYLAGGNQQVNEAAASSLIDPSPIPSSEATPPFAQAAWIDADSQAAASLPRGVVAIKTLPAPDALEFAFPKGHSCLITDDGGPLTAALAGALQSRGWPVVVLSFPSEIVPSWADLPDGVERVMLAETSEAHLQQRLAEAARPLGPAAMFIHLSPAGSTDAATLSFSDAEKSVLKHVFLMAKHLKEPLNEAAHTGRAAFLTVTRLDGKFGLGQEGDFTPVIGGLTGLVKTLNLEWEPVFCRAVDLNPALDVEKAVQCILAELSDPNRLITEVGYGPQGRCTLIVKTPVA